VSKWVAEGASELGAEVKIIDAAHLKYKTNGCTSCFGCQESEDYRCIIQDEASDIIATIPEYDVLVFATPIYFFGLSAQIKLMMDRMYSLFKFKDNEIVHNLHNTKLALIATAAGDVGSGLDMADLTIKKLSGLLGHKHKSLLLPYIPVHADQTATDLELKERAINFGAELARV